MWRVDDQELVSAQPKMNAMPSFFSMRIRMLLSLGMEMEITDPR